MIPTKLMGAKMEHGLSLSKDMLIEILIYLPAKSLMRFTCVSKNWFNFIKSQYFVTRHLGRDGMETLLLKRSLPPRNGYEIPKDRKTFLTFHDPNSPDALVLPTLSAPFLDDDHQDVIIFGPGNGLICLVCGDIIILCNPALREFELLDPTPFSCAEEYITRYEASGFGFDVENDCYKIVQIWDIAERRCEYPDEDSYNRIDLYNSSTNSWKNIDATVPIIHHNIGFHLIFNGAFHWWANKIIDEDEYIDEPLSMGVILSFNISTEVFKEFEFPDNDAKYPSLTVLNHCLALIHYGGWHNNEEELVDIWIMKEYGIKESWTKELVIGPYVFRFPFVSWNNEWIVAESNSQLAFFAIHKYECRKYQFSGYKGSLDALIFSESLISLKATFCCKRL